ncbi:hypothetical protein CBOM_05712 [Ceraceosorus bombacis]|uniref:Uncharacterized protein n=1 Tax=Ceraceosorus bombacis TaxID=401625 RepID=A0A0P1BS72_9BASI|nr:hypothetical protein CBOM_05712 [Ceraceosorus bombacis]
MLALGASAQHQLQITQAQNKGLKLDEGTIDVHHNEVARVATETYLAGEAADQLDEDLAELVQHHFVTKAKLVSSIAPDVHHHEEAQGAMEMYLVQQAAELMDGNLAEIIQDHFVMKAKLASNIAPGEQCGLAAFTICLDKRNQQEGPWQDLAL